MIGAVQSSYWAPLWDLTARQGCPAVSHRSDVSGHSGVAPPRSQPLCPGTDSLSLPLITYMPVGHLSADPTDFLTVGFQQLSGFVLVSLKASTAAGKLTLISGAVVSCLLLSWCCMSLCREKKFLQTGQCFRVCLYQILRSWPWVFLVSLQTALAPKPRLKKVRNLSYCTLVIPPVIIPGCPETWRQGVEGFLLSFCPTNLYFVIFICSTTHVRMNTSLEAFITYETGGGESWAVSHSWEASEKWCCDLNATDANMQFAFFFFFLTKLYCLPFPFLNT